MSTTALQSLIVPAHEASIYDQLAGEKIIILLSGQDTGGAFAMFIDEVPPGGGPPRHIHHNEDETFYVLAGTLEIQVGEDMFIAPAGATAFLPKGIPHTFTNSGPETARALVLLTPAGLEPFFAEVEPLVTQSEPDMTAIMAVASKYNILVVGPPLAATNGRHNHQ